MSALRQASLDSAPSQIVSSADTTTSVQLNQSYTHRRSDPPQNMLRAPHSRPLHLAQQTIQTPSFAVLHQNPYLTIMIRQKGAIVVYYVWRGAGVEDFELAQELTVHCWVGCSGYDLMFQLGSMMAGMEKSNHSGRNTLFYFGLDR